MLLLAALHRNRINERQFSKMRWRIGRICLFLNANVVDCLCSFHPQVATRCLHLLLAHHFYWQHSVFSMYIFAVYSSLGTFFFWFSSCPLLDYDYSSSFQLCWHKRLLFMIMLMWCQFSMLFSLILSPSFFTWGENRMKFGWNSSAGSPKTRKKHRTWLSVVISQQPCLEMHSHFSSLEHFKVMLIFSLHLLPHIFFSFSGCVYFFVVVVVEHLWINGTFILAPRQIMCILAAER